MALKFHAKQWFNVRDEKRIADDESLQNFHSEQFGLQKELENTQVQTRMHKIPNNEIGGQSTNETRNESEFTSDEFKEHLAKLSLRKAQGTNGIRPELIVYGGERLHTLLLKLFNKCWMGKQNTPRAWVDATVMPIYKRKGSRSVHSSYRPIFLLDVIGKLYASMVVGRLNKTVAARLAEAQHGFRKGYSTEQAILAVRTIIKKSLDR